MLANCDVIAIFPIYGQFGAIQKPDSRQVLDKGIVLPPKNKPLKSPPRIGLKVNSVSLTM